MKLIDILIKNDVQWPSGADGAVQDFDGEIMFFVGEKPSFDGVWCVLWPSGAGVHYHKSIILETASDCNTKIVTKQEWEKCKTSKAMFADVELGDKVWDIRMGWGKVTELDYSDDYPVVVNFGGNYDTYTLDGYCYVDNLNPSLFWDEIEIKAPPKPLKPPPKLDVDTKVIVWDDGDTPLRRHFSHFNEDGVIHVFYNGKTSFTNDGKPTRWANWKLAE